MLQTSTFKLRFLNLILLTWMVPPVVGLGFIVYLRILTPEQVLGILVTPLEPLYILGWLGFAVWYFPRYIRPVVDWLEQGSANAEAAALQAMRRFPLRYWSIFLLYLLFAPGSVIVAAELFTDFVAQPVDWFRIQLVALIVSIIVGLPIFFRILDLFGQSLGTIRLTTPQVTLKAKVFLIGALVPLLIDTMLVQYFWTRTGYFTVETFIVWLALELLAIAGSLIFVHSIGQSLSPLQDLIGKGGAETAVDYSTLLSMSTDELGVLTSGYRSLLHDLSVHNEILTLNNRLLRRAGEASELPPLLDTVVDLCREAIGGDQVYLLLEDTDGKALACVSRTGADYSQVGHFRLPLDEEALPALVYRQGETLAIDDVTQESRVDPRLCNKLDAVSVIATPLKSEGGTLGVLLSVNSGLIHRYTRREVVLMESLAREAAVAINTARLKALHLAAERERAQQDERYRRLVQSTTAIPWEMDLDSWRFTYIGHQAESVLGYPVEDWYGEEFWQQHVHPDDVEDAISLCATAADRGEDHEFEYRMFAADGRVVWIRDDAKVIRDNGKPVGLQGFMFDITQRKQAEINLTRSESGLAEAQRIAGLGSWELDIETDVLTWSNEIFRIFEIDPSRFEASYEVFLDAVHPEDRAMVNDAYAHSLETTQPYDIEHRLLMSDGRVKYVHEYCETQYSRAGKPLRSIGTVQDITERVRIEQELRRHRQNLEKLVEERTAELSSVNQELETFSYSVSHDLRAPLRAIDGFARALDEDYGEVIAAEGREFIERIHSNIARMTALIDDLLSLSRLGRMEMKIEVVDLAGLAGQVMNELRDTDPGRQVEFNVSLDTAVRGDARFLRIVLENLLGNAWKYSRNENPARITLGVIRENSEAAYFVRDNGVGFDMNNVDKLFGAFQRLHREEEFEGNGIGLATVARIVHRHGGRVWAESVPDNGATFYFTLGTGRAA